MRAYRVAYDGQPFAGFQRQPDEHTVEDALLDALRGLGVLDDGDVPDGYAAAGRTDAGVSAVEQTVAFAAPDWLTPAAFNSELPADVRAWASADAPADFHATHHAASRTYTYHLHAPDASVERARTACDAFTGEHDFHNLTPDDDGTVRDIALAVARDGPFLVLDVTAGGFARQLVRRVVTVVAAVARDTATERRIERVLGDESLSGPAGVAPAPAFPLVLTDVTYPMLDFSVDADAADSVAVIFDQRRVEHATRARVLGLLADRG